MLRKLKVKYAFVSYGAILNIFIYDGKAKIFDEMKAERHPNLIKL